MLDGKVSLAVSVETQPQGLQYDSITSAGANACGKGELAVSALQLFYWNFFMSLRTPWWSSSWVCGSLVPEGDFHMSLAALGKIWQDNLQPNVIT